MTEDTGTAETQPAEDLRSTLMSAVEESEKPETPKAPDAVETPAVDTSADATATDDKPDEPKPERTRGPDGKFAKKEGEEAAKPETETKPEEKKPDALEPPVNWKATDKDAFKKLPTDAQKLIVDRHKEMETDYTRKTMALSALKTDYEPVQKLLEPFRETMRQRGFTPHALIEAWSNVERKLAGGQDSAIDVVAGLVRGYKLPLEKLSAALGIKSGVPEATDEVKPESFQLPPDVVARLSKLDALEQQVNGLTDIQRRSVQAQNQAREQSVHNEIEQFKSAKDDKGNLLHPHFDEVELHMTQLANAAVVSKQAIPPIQDLYETAVWANPSTREKLRTAETQQAEKTRAEEARAKAAAAKRAASSVTGSPGAGQTIDPKRKPERSLREELDAAAEDSLSA